MIERHWGSAEHAVSARQHVETRHGWQLELPATTVSAKPHVAESGPPSDAAPGPPFGPESPVAPPEIPTAPPPPGDEQTNPASGVQPPNSGGSGSREEHAAMARRHARVTGQRTPWRQARDAAEEDRVAHTSAAIIGRTKSSTPRC